MFIHINTQQHNFILPISQTTLNKLQYHIINNHTHHQCTKTNTYLTFNKATVKTLLNLLYTLKSKPQIIAVAQLLINYKYATTFNNISHADFDFHEYSEIEDIESLYSKYPNLIKTLPTQYHQLLKNLKKTETISQVDNLYSNFIDNNPIWQ